MVIDFDAEACRQCTLKHLSTAIATLTDAEMPSVLRQVYFCGNLSHAANHLIHLDEQLAEDVRVVRLDAQDDSLNFKLGTEEITNRLLAIIEKISALTLEPPAPAVIPTPPTKQPTTPKVATTSTAQPVQKRGCPCHAK